MAKAWFRAALAFEDFAMGQLVELDEQAPRIAALLGLGYLEKIVADVHKVTQDVSDLVDDSENAVVDEAANLSTSGVAAAAETVVEVVEKVASPRRTKVA